MNFQVIDTCTDITNLIAGTFRFTVEKEKLAARGQLCSDKFPMYFKAMEDILKENGSNGEEIQSNNAAWYEYTSI